MAITKVNFFAALLLAALISLPALASDANRSASAAVPGSINYVEGQVSIGAQSLDSKSIGTAELQTGESLTTGKGKAEILLTPGVFLRVGNNSSVKMISPSLTDTELSIDKGHAMVEVAEIHPENDIRISEDGGTTRLLKTGLYDFNSKQGELRVFDGKASVDDGGKDVTVKGGRDLNLAENGSLKAAKFDKKAYEEGDLYRWSSLRSAYVAEANVDQARMYAADGAGAWGLNAWAWNPWFDAYTFVPGDGIWYSPFGWGFYSPWLAYEAPFFGYGYYGGGRYPYRFSNYGGWAARSPYIAGSAYAHGIYRGESSVGGRFHSGVRMAGESHGFGAFGNSGFHGGAVGSFHSSGGFSGGGFHGAGGFGGGRR